jgi:hypothetical protein
MFGRDDLWDRIVFGTGLICWALAALALSVYFLKIGFLWGRIALGNIARKRRVMDYRDRSVLSTLLRIEDLLAAIERYLRPTGFAQGIEFFVTIDGQQRKVEQMFLKVTQKLPVSIAIKDAKGNPAKVDGVPAWAVSDAALATLQVADDGMSAMIVPIGPIGSFKVQVSADADLTEGVKTILGELAIDLIGAEAVSVELTAGEPVDIP